MVGISFKKEEASEKGIKEKQSLSKNDLKVVLEGNNVVYWQKQKMI